MVLSFSSRKAERCEYSDSEHEQQPGVICLNQYPRKNILDTGDNELKNTLILTLRIE